MYVLWYWCLCAFQHRSTEMVAFCCDFALDNVCLWWRLLLWTLTGTSMYSFAYKLSRSKCYFRISLFVMSMAISCHGDTLALWNVGVPFSTPNGITLLRTRASPKQGSTQGNSEHRPNFNNALTLGLYPVKERNFFEMKFPAQKMKCSSSRSFDKNFTM